MIDLLIENYIKKLSIQDIINFAELHNIELSYNEADYIIPYIKYNWKVFIYGNANPILEEIRKNVPRDTFDKYAKLIIIIRNYINKFQS